MDFLPTTSEECDKRGWDTLDVILVSGDSYIDSPFIGVAVIGRLLASHGYRVGIIAQPDWTSATDITRLGEPTLFWGVSGGSVDSMVANYTALKKKRRSDDFTPGGVNNRRPDRASVVYSNLIRRFFKNTVPVVLGGIEASLRRVAHYDYWSDRVRRSILFDAKADALIYGMGEKPVLSLAEALKRGQDFTDIKSLCYISDRVPDGYIELPTFEQVEHSKASLTEMFHTFYKNNDPLTARGLAQLTDTRYLVQNPPAQHLSQSELDKVYETGFMLDQHPFYQRYGDVKALETIRFSLTTHRGCYGECNFCAIAVHQGQTVQWRSERSVLREARRFRSHPKFRGVISDVGGPTANMYGYECARKLRKGCCEDKRCLYPRLCPTMRPDHGPHMRLLNKLRKIDGVRKVFVASGLRYDLVLGDTERGRDYLNRIVGTHTSGQLKVAPEHTEESVLKQMGKPGADALAQFHELFATSVRKTGRDQYLTYYLIAAHPGCTDKDMKRARSFASRQLRINPRQVQIFTPLPSTYSALAYYTERDPFSGEPVYVEKDLKSKKRQKDILLSTAETKTSRDARSRRPRTKRRRR